MRQGAGMKITVIGMGAVGTEVVGHLLNSGVASEIVVIDQAAAKAQAELWDFSHTTSFIYAQNPRLTAGDYADSAGSDIVVITAGAQIKPGQTRDALAQINSAIMKSIIAEVERTSPDAIVLMVTNPVDILVQVVLRHSSFPKERVISLGTIIDTARFMRIVSEHVAIDPKNIFGWVLGDHSETGFIPWSLCNVCGLDVDSYCELNGLPSIDRVGCCRSASTSSRARATPTTASPPRCSASSGRSPATSGPCCRSARFCKANMAFPTW